MGTEPEYPLYTVEIPGESEDEHEFYTEKEAMEFANELKQEHMDKCIEVIGWVPGGGIDILHVMEAVLDE